MIDATSVLGMYLAMGYLAVGAASQIIHEVLLRSRWLTVATIGQYQV